MANVHRACAACSHQRRSCSTRCELAPYFPAEKMEDFLTVHGIYGVCRFIKIMDSVPNSEKSRVAETIILEARMRKIDPVHGSLAVVSRIEEEKKSVKELIDVLRKDTHFIKSTTEIENEMIDMETVLDTDSLEFVCPNIEEGDGSCEATPPAGYQWSGKDIM